VIAPDINLLLYAYDSESPFHPSASAWWRRCLSQTEPIGLAPVVIFGFLRLATNPRAFRDPMTVAESVDRVRSWLEQGVVQVVEPGPHHVVEVMKLLEGLGAAGNLVTDAQIAAVAIEHGAVLHTADADFQRFPGLRWYNPITGLASTRFGRRR
jgi:toxin-antitoxin system PIN domain toxin